MDDAVLFGNWEHVFQPFIYTMKCGPDGSSPFSKILNRSFQNVLSGGQICTIHRPHPGSQRILSTLFVAKTDS